MKGKKVSLVTLGCFRNRYDSEVAAKRLLAKEDILLPADEISKKNKADTLIINTCGFIDPAKLESIQVIRDALKLKQEKKVKNIYVFGCLVERFKNELEKHFPEIDKWWGREAFGKKYKQRLIAKKPVDFIKICEGCNNYCSYCAIPLIKGSLISRLPKDVLKEVAELEKKGIKELNIIGQDITSWAKDLKIKQNLTSLLKSIVKKTKSIKWLRLIYTHPKHLSDDLISLIESEEKICNYIDLPIQHINQRILKLMNRNTNQKKIMALIKKIRKKIPNCAIRTSVIVGFPTETESEFKELLNFIKKVKFEKLGVFTYSQEEGTKAAKLAGQVHHMTKKRRMREIMEIQQEITANKLKEFIGKKIKVLVLGKGKDYYLGRTEYDAPEVDGLVFINRKKMDIGQFYSVEIVDSLEYDLIAK